MLDLELESIIKSDVLDNTYSKMSDFIFLEWLYSRLKHKYQENINLLSRFKSIIDSNLIMPKLLNPVLVDRCCRKHFFDFDMEKTHDFKVGYTESEREDLRKLVKDIYCTIIEYQSE